MHEGRPQAAFGRFIGADDGSRTRDLELGKLSLYQLSYVRNREAYCRTGVARAANHPDYAREPCRDRESHERLRA